MSNKTDFLLEYEFSCDNCRFEARDRDSSPCSSCIRNFTKYSDRYQPYPSEAHDDDPLLDDEDPTLDEITFEDVYFEDEGYE